MRSAVRSSPTTTGTTGVFVNCVLSPATPPGRALIRTSLMATHTQDQLARALDAFEKVGREVGLVRTGRA